MAHTSRGTFLKYVAPFFKYFMCIYAFLGGIIALVGLAWIILDLHFMLTYGPYGLVLPGNSFKFQTPACDMVWLVEKLLKLDGKYIYEDVIFLAAMVITEGLSAWFLWRCTDAFTLEPVPETKERDVVYWLLTISLKGSAYILKENDEDPLAMILIFPFIMTILVGQALFWKRIKTEEMSAARDREREE